MTTLIEKLRNDAMKTYTYSDCDGGNNRGVELNEIKFAEAIIENCTKTIIKAYNGHINPSIALAAIKDQYGIDLTKYEPYEKY